MQASSTTFSYQNGEWMNRNRKTYTYNEQNLETSVVNVQWIDDGWLEIEKVETMYVNSLPKMITNFVYDGQWQNKGLIELTYNEDGNVLTRNWSEWFSTGEWVTKTKKNFAYNEDKLPTLETCLLYNGIKFMNSYKYEWTYNSKQEVEKITSLGDDFSDRWVLTDKQAYAYSDNGIKTSETQYRYSSKTSAWKESVKISFEYNDQQILVLKKISNYNDGQWEQATTFEITPYSPYVPIFSVLKINKILFPYVYELDYITQQPDETVAMYAPAQSTCTINSNGEIRKLAEATCFYSPIATVPDEKYTITVTAGENGIVTPTGNVEMKRGESQTFTITPNTDYQISDVKVDGISVGKVNEYTFKNVVSDHTLEAIFAFGSNVDQLRQLNTQIYSNGKSIMIDTEPESMIYIIDVTGRVIESRVADDGKLTIPMDNSGMYMVKVASSSEKIKIAKVIIK